MIQRCEDKHNKGYGGRGITVCDSWRQFINFYSDMSEQYFEGGTLERLDVNGNYSPDNCTWVDRARQTRNRRKQCNNTSGITGVFLSTTLNVWTAQWRDEHGIRRSKSFSVSKYGEVAAKNLAIAAREAAIEILSQKGVIYGKYHGLAEDERGLKRL
jgi:hypothetical protein